MSIVLYVCCIQLIVLVLLTFFINFLWMFPLLSAFFELSHQRNECWLFWSHLSTVWKIITLKTNIKVEKLDPDGSIQTVPSLMLDCITVTCIIRNICNKFLCKCPHRSTYRQRIPGVLWYPFRKILLKLHALETPPTDTAPSRQDAGRGEVRWASEV